MRASLAALAVALAAGAPSRAEEAAHAPAPAEHHDAAPAPSGHHQPAAAPTEVHGAAGQDHAAPTGPKPVEAPAVRALPGFAAELAQRPAFGAAMLKSIPDAKAWHALATAPTERRQAARWDFVLSMLASSRAAEAMGALQTMAHDDPDLALVPAFQTATGMALALLDRDAEAMTTLSAEALARDAEACAWRLRIQADAARWAEAIGEVPCALPAINARDLAGRMPFVLAAAEAAIESGRTDQALAWLAPLPDRDPAANLLRGRAYAAKGDLQAARLRFDRAALAGTPEQSAEARLGILEAGIHAHRDDPAKALDELEKIRFSWRGGRVEERALRLELAIANEKHDLKRALQAGATLFRYFHPGAEANAMLAQLQAGLAAILMPDSKVPLPEAAGLYWDYRELAPAGAEGDAMAMRLAERLRAVGLYARAADLLDYQLSARAQDVAKGPLSIKVATLRILANQPSKALKALHDSEDPNFPDAMRQDRKRIEAVALFRMGKAEAAAAALEGLPDAGAVRAEFAWQRDDWQNFVTSSEGSLPAPGALGEAQQALVLRHAVALAMIGREDKLQALRKRYAASFAKLPSGGAFDVLTQPAGSVDAARMEKAMAAIPSASPVGALGDLLDAS